MLDIHLKEYTRHEHVSLEKKLLSKIKNINHLQDYVTLLSIFYGYYFVLEKQLLHFLEHSEVSDYAARQKSRPLHREIQALDPTHVQQHYCNDLPEIRSFYGALGVLYVLEGSTLGGQIIARILAGKIDHPIPCTFFLSYGEEVNVMWDRFRNYLRKPYSPEQQAEIVRAAQQTFITFNNWLSHHDQD